MEAILLKVETNYKCCALNDSSGRDFYSNNALCKITLITLRDYGILNHRTRVRNRYYMQIPDSDLNFFEFRRRNSEFQNRINRNESDFVIRISST